MWDAAVEGTREWKPARDQAIFRRRRSWKPETRDGRSEAEEVASVMIGEEALKVGDVCGIRRRNGC